MMLCNDCHLIGWLGSPDVCPKCGGTDVVMTLGFYTKEELDEIAEERGDEFGICNTGNEVIEPLTCLGGEYGPSVNDVLKKRLEPLECLRPDGRPILLDVWGNERDYPIQDDEKGIFYACQDRMPLRPSECFSAKDVEGIMGDLDVHGCPSWVNPVTWEVMQRLIRASSR